MNVASNRIPRVAVVGCGAVVESLHAPALRVLSNRNTVRVVAAMDPDKNRREAIASKFPGCSPVEYLDGLSEDLDLAVIASPLKFHTAQTVQLLERGVHVLCEKPMAESVKECEEMIAAADRSGAMLAVGHIRRFYASTRRVREVLVRQSMGKVESFRMIEAAKNVWPAFTDACFRKESGGGVLLNVGIHLLDVMVYWFGVPDRIECFDDAMGGVEINSRIHVTYDGGPQGDILLSGDWNLQSGYFIQLEKGWINCAPNDPNNLDIGFTNETALKSSLNRVKTINGLPVIGDAEATFQKAFVRQLQNVLNAICGRGSLHVSGEEAVKAIKVIETCKNVRQLAPMFWMTEAERIRALEIQS